MKAKHVFVEAKPPEFLVCNGEWQHLPAGASEVWLPGLFPGRETLLILRARLKSSSGALATGRVQGPHLHGMYMGATCSVSLWMGAPLGQGVVHFSLYTNQTGHQGSPH